MTRRKARKASARVAYSPTELALLEILDQRADYAATRRHLRTEPAARHHELLTYSIETAHRVSTMLGHLALRQGTSVECSRCGASGRLHTHLIGDVFVLACGEAAWFGYETTIEQHRTRARWEHAFAAELEAAQDPDLSPIIEAHRNAAAAYERRVIELHRKGTP